MSFDIKGDIEIPDGYKELVVIKNQEESTLFVGSQENLRKILFWIADVLWPGWYEDDQGRETYHSYTEQAKNGSIVLADKNFLSRAWHKVQEHARIDGIAFVVANQISIK